MTLDKGIVGESYTVEALELPDQVDTGDEMELSLADGTATAKGNTYPCTKLPPYMQQILNHGGLIASLNEEERL